MFGLRLTLWPTVFVIPALALLVGLGVWQLERLEQKTDLLARIEAGMFAEPAVLPATLSNPDEWHYRRVSVEGIFLHERELFLTGRVFRGQAGLHVVTPLRRTDAAADGSVILIDRGWIPQQARDRATRTDGLPDGTVRVTGITRQPPDRGWMQPDNDPVGNLWFWLDLPVMADAAGVAPVPVLILEADAAGGALPVGGQTRLDIPNNHLAYAVTWFAFAVTLLVIYVLYHRRPANDGETSLPGSGPEPT